MNGSNCDNGSDEHHRRQSELDPFQSVIAQMKLLQTEERLESSCGGNQGTSGKMNVFPLPKYETVRDKRHRHHQVDNMSVETTRRCNMARNYFQNYYQNLFEYLDGRKERLQQFKLEHYEVCYKY